jgi:hypothetical protein
MEDLPPPPPPLPPPPASVTINDPAAAANALKRKTIHTNVTIVESATRYASLCSQIKQFLNFIF